MRSASSLTDLAVTGGLIIAAAAIALTGSAFARHTAAPALAQDIPTCPRFHRAVLVRADRLVCTARLNRRIRVSPFSRPAAVRELNRAGANVLLAKLRGCRPFRVVSSTESHAIRPIRGGIRIGTLTSRIECRR